MTIAEMGRAGLVLAVVALAPFSGLAAQAEPPPVDPDALKRLTLEELMDLEVTSASRTPVPFGQVAAALQVITQDQIRRAGASTIAEALRLATNLTVARKNSSAWAISARGFNADLANKLLVLIDGRTVYTPLFSGVFWDRQDYLLEDIDRIEVIAGPGGALWGANAVNGVLNIITKSAAESQGLYVTGGVGSQVETIAGARWGGAAGSALTYRLYATYLDRDGEVFPDGSDAPDEWNRLQGGFRADAGLSERDGLTVQGDLYEGEQEGLSEGRIGETSGGNLLARWTRTRSEESGLVLQLYFDRTHLRLPTPPRLFGATGVVIAPAGTVEDDLDTYDVDFQHNFVAGARHRIVWGLGYRRSHDDVSNAPGLAFEPPELELDLFSVFAQDEVALGPRLALVIGSKVEHNDYTGLEVEPSARLRWNAAPDHIIWGAVSRAVRMPSRVDRHMRFPTPALAPAGVPYLLAASDTFVSETLVAYELGYRAQVGSALGVSISTFYNEYDDLRSASLSPPGPPPLRLPFPLFFANDLEATTYGAEVVVNLRPTETVGVKLGYTWLHEDVDVTEGGQDANNGFNETADPQQQLFVQTALDLPFALEADAAFRWIDRFVYNGSGGPTTLPSYAEIDARLAWRPTPLFEIAVIGRNLLDDQHLEYVIASPDPREEIERSVEGRVTIRW